jgi:DNA polymerase-3 subunit epsilon
MKRSIKLTRPLAVLDLETTGTSPQIDRIIEIAILRIHPDGSKDDFQSRINPECPIPAEATEVHGIRNEDVKRCPSFKKLAPDIIRFLKDCDLAGYNLISFDIPFLRQEYLRAEIEFTTEKRRIVDACRIFHQMERRDLISALKFFCNEEHSQAHSALGDVKACWKILQAQVIRYTDLPIDPDGLHGFCNQQDERFVDSDRKFEWRNKEATFTFGKYKGRSLKEVAKEDPGFLEWMKTRDFSDEVKQIVEKALKGKLPKR